MKSIQNKSYKIWRINLLLFCLIYRASTFAQINSDSSSQFRISGYADSYYLYDFSNPKNHERDFFIYNYKRHNEFNVNLALIYLNYQNEKSRASIGLQAGTYPQYNYANEFPVMRFIHQANAGICLSKNLWLDAGIFPSHLGFESPIGKDNWTLTRSIMADNTPYYETGAKISWESNKKWTFKFLVLNGWQNIRENNSGKALGTQIIFHPTQNLIFNSSSFAGNEGTDFHKQIRYFHNFYFVYGTDKKLGVTGAFDVGIEKNVQSGETSLWYNPNLIVRYRIHPKINIAGRVEYYHDPKGMIMSQKFHLMSNSLNIDYIPSKNLMLRAEMRTFQRNQLSSKLNMVVSSTMAISF